MSLVFLILITIFFLFGFVVFRGAPYVPTKKTPLHNAFDKLYRLSSKDLLVDIGSGDGMVLREAASRGARAVGYELNPLLVIISRAISRNSLISIHLADYQKVVFPKETTIVYTFGDSRDIARMYKKTAQQALNLKKDLYFLSFAFSVPGVPYLRHDGQFYLYKIKYLHTSEA